MKDSSEELQKVSDFYGSDFDKGQLEAQLSTCVQVKIQRIEGRKSRSQRHY